LKRQRLPSRRIQGKKPIPVETIEDNTIRDKRGCEGFLIDLSRSAGCIRVI
jgi:hypothetical protein